MSIKVRKEALEKFLSKVLFEQDSTTTITVPDAMPIDASEEMATQLSIERPPIEDKDYIPSSPKELGEAARAWARMVPDDEVEKFYSDLKTIYEKALASANDPEISESKIRSTIKSILHEVITDDDKEDLRQFRTGTAPDREYDTGGIDFFGDDDNDLEAPGVDTSDPGSSLEDLAKKFGYSGPSGVRQDLERIFKRLGYSVENISDKDLDTIRSYARDEYVELFEKLELADEQGIKDLKDNPYQHVDNTDSFRFFLVSGFVLPAYQKILRNARKRVESEIEKLGVPKKSKQTILNQALGDTPKNFNKLNNKLLRNAKEEGYTADEARELLQKVRASFSKLENLAKMEGNLVSVATDIWQSSSPAKKKKILTQAFQSTSEFQG